MQVLAAGDAASVSNVKQLECIHSGMWHGRSKHGHSLNDQGYRSLLGAAHARGVCALPGGRLRAVSRVAQYLLPGLWVHQCDLLMRLIG